MIYGAVDPPIKTIADTFNAESGRADSSLSRFFFMIVQNRSEIPCPYISPLPIIFTAVREFPGTDGHKHMFGASDPKTNYKKVTALDYRTGRIKGWVGEINEHPLPSAILIILIFKK